MHALVYKQLIGEAIGVKAKKADVGVVFNVGGSAVAVAAEAASTKSVASCLSEFIVQGNCRQGKAMAQVA
jgi:hypothetical protein